MLFGAPGTYWISVRDTVAGSDFLWESATPNGDGTAVYRLTNTGAWAASPTGFASTDTQALRIEGNLTTVVPESSTLALALPALGMIALCNRVGAVVIRRRKK